MNSKNKSKLKFILFTIVVLVVCFAIGYFIGKYLYEQYAAKKNLSEITINYLV